MALAEPPSQSIDPLTSQHHVGFPKGPPIDGPFNISTSQHGPTNNVTSSGTSPAHAAAYPALNLQLEDHHIDDVRSLRVIVIGAGLAGILAGILLPAKVPGIQLTILEKNADVVK